MDSFFTEIVAYFQPPSPDARLVLFSDEDIHTSKLDVYKHLQLCAEYAEKYEVYLVSGLLVHNKNLCLCLFGPDGKILCRQAAVQLSMARRGKLVTDDHLQVIGTEIGNLALCVDIDIYHPQVARTLALKGADVLLSVQSLDPAEDTADRLMCSVWNAAQTNNIYIVNLSGNSCTVCCPAPLTRNKNGYLVQRTSIVPVRFGLNLERLDQIREEFPLLENINTALVKRYTHALKQR